MDKRPPKSNSKCCGEEVTLALPQTESAEQLAKLTWAIAHPARVRIVQLLLSRTSCVCGEIVDQMPLAQSTVSQHLKILKDSGLVQGEIDGPRICYCINQKILKQLKRLVADL
jgi:ArsR family transcriptional regulator, arsenate/arsenite/antimonite-responsive transcriptional repressor